MMADFPPPNRECEESLFADEIEIPSTAANKWETEIILQEYLQRTEEWANTLKLTFSVPKCVAVNFTRKKTKDRKLNLTLNNSRITEKSNSGKKFLGAMPSSKLHKNSNLRKINTTIKTASKNLRRSDPQQNRLWIPHSRNDTKNKTTHTGDHPKSNITHYPRLLQVYTNPTNSNGNWNHIHQGQIEHTRSQIPSKFKKQAMEFYIPYTVQTSKRKIQLENKEHMFLEIQNIEHQDHLAIYTDGSTCKTSKKPVQYTYLKLKQKKHGYSHSSLTALMQS
ncbi:hypothetical protein OUZ56_029907 [Daphnia magna]|uniref:Uncharacterized protein n=1 Tax=Daphnia magna TaxID=35525 RepID=A0ABR0B890_9CRUS|nr:hypothetical protein OUZ56_029907 [Daphnia magna]